MLVFYLLQDPKESLAKITQHTTLYYCFNIRPMYVSFFMFVQYILGDINSTKFGVSSLVVFALHKHYLLNNQTNINVRRKNTMWFQYRSLVDISYKC